MTRVMPRPSASQEDVPSTVSLHSACSAHGHQLPHISPHQIRAMITQTKVTSHAHAYVRTQSKAPS